ncbi:MAG: trypsin-like peptidase domain-containing protein [Acidobacteria bacterium]|nr:trypsin-like peptidase domain-containing protein [Acidobacteriota bacterium]MBS1867215.1 trypsin-like peptidase domain-containing protein [Acidobacteriota bacterium]
MPEKREVVVIVEPDAVQGAALAELLSSAGYAAKVAGSQAEGFRLVQEEAVDLFILRADLMDLQCCDALAEIKGAASTAHTQVLLLLSGGPTERARGLDLGADDVLTVPPDSAEFLARVRSLLRMRHAAEALERQAQIADQGREMAQTALQAVAVTEKMTRDAFSLERALKIGVSALFAIALAIAGIFFLFSRKAEKENTLAHMVIAQMQRGLVTQDQLMAETKKAREELAKSDPQIQKQDLQEKSEELKEKMASATGDTSELRKQLDETNSRLARVQSDSEAAETVIRVSAPSVCLLHVSVAFRDRNSGRLLRYGGITPAGEPLKDSDGNIVYSLEGRAPEVRQDFFGTGFVVGEGRILTNHHVAEPWWKNDEMGAVLKQGLEPAIAEMAAYFPDSGSGIPMEIQRISGEADLALLHGDLSGVKRPTLRLDSRPGAAISGQSLISLGYATGISAILARAGDDTVDQILKVSGGDPKLVMDELAKRKLIRPLVTQGHIGDVLTDKIVYDAQTTSGGSGGPLMNKDGRVIGVTFAVVRGFGGSNFGVPIRFAEPLLKR